MGSNPLFRKGPLIVIGQKYRILNGICRIGYKCMKRGISKLTKIVTI